MTTALHIVTGLFAMIGAYSVIQEVPRVRQRTRARRHAALIERIAHLEITTGVGLDVGREWIERQPLRTKDESYNYIGQWYCYGCEQWFEARGQGFHKLCKSCARNASPTEGVAA